MDLTDEMIGRRISCMIHRDIVEEGVIYKYNNKFYIMQNVRNGSLPDENTTSCKWGWSVGKGLEENLRHNNVSNIKFIDNIIHEMW